MKKGEIERVGKESKRKRWKEKREKSVLNKSTWKIRHKKAAKYEGIRTKI